MPSPREIALKVNRKDLFADPADDAARFNETEGIPKNGPGCGGLRRERDDRANPENEPSAQAPCRNLHSERPPTK